VFITDGVFLCRCAPEKGSTSQGGCCNCRAFFGANIKENCLVKITDGRGSGQEIFITFFKVKKEKEEVMPFYKRLGRSLSTPKARTF
jgi:hypothetical protein